MASLFNNRLRLMLSLVCGLVAIPSFASHLIGDEFTYKYLGDTSISGATRHIYEVTLNLYADCLAGTPDAILQDNPAFLAVYNGTAFVGSDSVFFASSETIPAMSTGPCGTGGSPLCVLKRTFIKRYYLAPSTSAYTVAYQRCCKNVAVTNITDPGNTGSTYFVTIPSSGTCTTNTSAVFNSYPPLEIGMGESFSFDDGATDTDGDSLSYELCTTFSGASASDVAPVAAPPPYDASSYITPRTWSDPVTCSTPLAIDAVSGMLSGVPSAIGRYLVSIACHEWRSGAMVNTTRREFELSVVTFTASFYHPFAGDDTNIYVFDTLQFAASDAVTYSWSPATYLSSPSIPNPTGFFPVAGTFIYVLHGVSDSGCTGNDTMIVNVLEHSEFTAPNAFTPNNDGVNDYFAPIPVKNSQLTGLKIYNRAWRLLYSSNSPNASWDGTYNGVVQEMGAYYYQILYVDNKGSARSKSGSVTLIR